MKLKNKVLVNILFFLFLILGCLSFVFLAYINTDKIFIPFCGKINSNIRVNVEIPKKNLKNFEFYSNSKILEPNFLILKNSYVYFEDALPSNVLYFHLKDKKILDSIEHIVISEGRNFYYYSNDDIKNFKHNEKAEYFFPSDIKYMKNSRYINDRGILHKLSVYYLSIFYNSNLYIISLFFFAISVLIYLSNKEKFNFNFNFLKNKAIWLILISAFLLRISFNSAPFWGDELYTVSVASGMNRPFVATLQDPGNPPLFFILAKIWILLFGSNESICRILPSIFSVLSIYLLYIFVKRNTNNEGFALLSAFILSLNVMSIRYANDFRAYSLMGVFCLLSAYYLFEIIKYKKTKDFIIYAIISCLMANTHYFQILFLFGNFLFGIIVLDNKSRVKFLFSNIFAAISFLPFFLTTALNKGLLDEEFNKDDMCDIDVMWHILSFYFKNTVATSIVFISAFLMGIKKIKEQIFKNDDNLFNLYSYFAYSILMLFVSSYLFSYCVKPIIRLYYYMGILPFACAMVAGLFFAPFKNKILRFLVYLYFLLFYIFAINGQNYFANTFGNEIIRLEELFKYQYYDGQKYINENKKVLIAVFDYPDEYTDFYNKYVDKNNVTILNYRFPYAKSKDLAKKIEELNVDVAYIMLHGYSYKISMKEFSKKFNSSLIITDEGVVNVKLTKR